jgi:vancomycin permeability regulator SanA
MIPGHSGYKIISMLKTLAFIIGMTIPIYLLFIFGSKNHIYNLLTAPKTDFLLVLGAGINKNGQPSKILEDRLISTLKYVQTHQPNIIVLSGTKRKGGYDETLPMKSFLIERGIDQKLIQVDPSGFSTLHSCINFKRNFGVHDVTIVSQRFHLYRSIILSRLIGLHSYGLAAETLQFKNIKTCFWYLREFIAIPYNLLKLFVYFMEILVNKLFHRYN